jgi:hypothetical protein
LFNSATLAADIATVGQISKKGRVKQAVWIGVGSLIAFAVWFDGSHPQTTEPAAPQNQTQTTRSPLCSPDYLHCAPGDPEDTGRY